MPQTLQDWLSHLESLHPKTIALGLERVAEVAERLQLKPGFPVITIGGTNGKGSVCAMLESILIKAGYRTGLYTSPHLLLYNERVRIAGKQASDAELCASFAAIEQARGKAQLTYFEFGTLAAMQSFIAHEVDVAILEVGLGGRLDAVNIFDTDCAAITSIDLDHMDFLGDTREKIAFEKAGIFRRGKVAIFGDMDMPQTIFHEAEKAEIKLLRLGHDFSYESDLQQWHYHGQANRYSLPFPALRGVFQLNNASTVLAILDAMHERLPVSMDAVRGGLVEVTLPGRFQVMPGNPQIIMDVAHNPHAARSLAGNLSALPREGKTWAVFAMLKDKDISGVVKELADVVDEWLVASLDGPRGASASELKEKVEHVTREALVLPFECVSDAYMHACNAAGGNDRIIVFGSFYTVAEVMRIRTG